MEYLGQHREIGLLLMVGLFCFGAAAFAAEPFGHVGALSLYKAIHKHGKRYRQVNLLASRKREHSRKPDEIYTIIQACSPGPYLELFAREHVPGWIQRGDEIETYMLNPKVFPGYHGNSRMIDTTQMDTTQLEPLQNGSKRVRAKH